MNKNIIGKNKQGYAIYEKEYAIKMANDTTDMEIEDLLLSNDDEKSLSTNEVKLFSQKNPTPPPPVLKNTPPPKNAKFFSEEKPKQQLSYNEKIAKSREFDEYYEWIINTFRIVSWQLINYDEPAPRSTIISRLNRLINKGLIKKSKKGFYHANDYKPSQNDRHNLWIAAIHLHQIHKGYDCYTDVDILKNNMNQFRFQRMIYTNDNFIPDLVSINNNNEIIAWEIELHKKKDDTIKNKIRAYIDSVNRGQFSKVHYITDNNRVKKQIEFWINHFKGKSQIKIITMTDEELMIK